MGKKPAPKAKAKVKSEAELKAEAEAEAEAKAKAEARRIWTQRKEASKWTQAQIDALVAQRGQAASKGESWLEAPHAWHENQLKKLLQRFELKLLDEVPAELKDGIVAYVAQCAGGADGKQEGFKDDRAMFKGLPELPDADDYERAEQTPEAVKAAEELGAWTETSEQGIAKFVALMKSHAESAGVAEAGLTRLGFLLSEEAKDEASRSAMKAETLMPAIEPAMARWIKDAEVQRKGCAALRGLAITKGQIAAMSDGGAGKLLVECLKMHLKNADLVLAGTAAVWEMSKAAGKLSPELSSLQSAGIIEVLQKIMVHHAWDQTLCGKVRVVLPFLVEE